MRKMSFRQWLGRKIAGNFYVKDNGVITDEMRAKALAIRRQETALKQAEKQLEFMERLNRLELKANPKESVMDMAIKQLLPILLAKANNGENTPAQVNNSINEQVFSKEQIKKLVELNPKLKANAQKFSDEQIREYLIQQVPNISAQSLSDIITEVRS